MRTHPEPLILATKKFKMKFYENLLSLEKIDLTFMQYL